MTLHRPARVPLDPQFSEQCGDSCGALGPATKSSQFTKPPIPHRPRRHRLPLWCHRPPAVTDLPPPTRPGTLLCMRKSPRPTAVSSVERPDLGTETCRNQLSFAYLQCPDHGSLPEAPLRAALAPASSEAKSTGSPSKPWSVRQHPSPSIKDCPCHSRRSDHFAAVATFA